MGGACGTESMSIPRVQHCLEAVDENSAISAASKMKEARRKSLSRPPPNLAKMRAEIALRAMAPDLVITCRWPEDNDTDDREITVKGWEEIGYSVQRELGPLFRVNRVSFAGQDVEPLSIRWEDLDVQDGATVSAFGIARKVVLEGHTKSVWGLEWIPGRELLASSADDNTIRLWDAAGTGDCIEVLEGHQSFVRCLAWVGDIKMKTVSGSGPFRRH